MAKVEGVTSWRCDRCGRQAQTPPGQSPTGWAKWARQPMGAPESAADDWDVCDGCDTMASRLMQPTDRPDNGHGRRMVGAGPPLTERQLVAGYGGPGAQRDYDIERARSGGR